MKIFVKVKPGAKEEKIERLDEINFKVAVKEPPVKGKANAALIKALAEYFGVNRCSVKIISGSGFRLKVIEIKK